jgi:hypothetical protein
MARDLGLEGRAEGNRGVSGRVVGTVAGFDFWLLPMPSEAEQYRANAEECARRAEKAISSRPTPAAHRS